MSEFVIISGSSPVFTEQLCALYKSALCIMPAVLNLIFDCLGFELAVTVYRGLFTGRPLFCISCVLCVPVYFGNVA